MPWVSTWSESERALLLRLRRGGASWREVGAALGRHKEACRFYARTTLGLGPGVRGEDAPDSGGSSPLPRRRPDAAAFARAAWQGEPGRGWADYLDDVGGGLQT